jgi:hypothetical protein
MYFKGKEHIVIQPIYENIRNSFTYEFWVKPHASHKIVDETSKGISGLSGQRYLIGPAHALSWETTGVGVSVGTNGVTVFEHTSSHLPALLVYEIPITEWTHVAIVFEDKTPSLFINGEFKSKGLSSSKNNVYASGHIGGYDPYGFYIGYIKDIKLWDFAKAETEIKEGMHEILTGEEEGLFRYWWFHNSITISPPNLINNFILTALPSKNI